MKTLTKCFLAVCLLAAALTARPAAAAYTISVEEFRNSTRRRIPTDSITEMMITELVNSGLFQVVERDRLDSVAREQRMGQQGLSSRSAPQTGRLAGAQYIMTGAVTRYERTGVGAGGFIGGGYGMTMPLIGSTTAYVTLDVRIVDTTTGAIVYAGRSEGAGTRVTAGLLSFYGGFGTGQSGGLMATATHKAVVRTIDNVRAAIGGGAAPGNAEGNHVLECRDGYATIDAGSSTAGARRGQLYAVYREGEPIRDLHGTVLDTERYYLAVLKVVEVHPQYSKAKVVRGGGAARGDLIEPIRKANDVRIYGE